MNHEEAMKMIDHNEEEFEVKKEREINGWKLMWVYYPKCPNGDKIMLFDMLKAPKLPYTRIMPHFGKEESPFARFEPTEHGWNSAIQYMNSFMNMKSQSVMKRIAIETRCPKCQSSIKGLLTNWESGRVDLRCWLCNHVWAANTEEIIAKDAEDA